MNIYALAQLAREKCASFTDRNIDLRRAIGHVNLLDSITRHLETCRFQGIAPSVEAISRIERHEDAATVACESIAEQQPQISERELNCDDDDDEFEDEVDAKVGGGATTYWDDSGSEEDVESDEEDGSDGEDDVDVNSKMDSMYSNQDLVACLAQVISAQQGSSRGAVPASTIAASTIAATSIAANTIAATTIAAATIAASTIAAPTNDEPTITTPATAAPAIAAPAIAAPPMTVSA